MSEMNEQELLNAIFYELKAFHAKVDATSDDLLHFRKEMQKFKNEMYEFKDEMHEFKDDMQGFRRETGNNFNKVYRQLRFFETDYDQLNNRVDKLEVSSNL